MIRNSHMDDIIEVVKTYDKILEDKSIQVFTGWQKNVYASHQTALNAHINGELFVMEVADDIVAAAIINHKQVPEYSNCEWEFSAPDSEIMVIHTLVVDPNCSGKGYATDFVSFYETYARESNCRYLRFDTNVTNVPARKLYKKLKYKEAGIVSCVFNGISGVMLVCLEKGLDG